MNLGFKIHFSEDAVYVSAGQLTGEVRDNVTVYKTKVGHVDVVWTHTAHKGGLLINLTASSQKPLGITRIDSVVLDMGIPCCTDHITLMGRETTKNEIRFPHELGARNEYCETAVGLYPTLDAKGTVMAGVAPFQNICLATARKDADGRFSFCVKTEYTKEMLDCKELKTELVYFHPDATIDELFTVYRELLPKSSFPMPKLTGWNSWDYYLDKVTAEDVLENITVLKDMPFAKELHYIVIDDGWQKGWGNWVENHKFACGLAAIAQQIRRAGFLPGIWMAPVGVKEDTAVFREHMDWLCRKPDGELLYNCHMYYLDPTHPDARKFILDNYRYQYQAGFKLFKMDFISPLLEVKSFYDKTVTPYGVITQLIADVKACTGPDIVILGCSVPLECGADIAPSMRIGLDIHNHFSHVASISRTIAWSWMYNNKVTRIDPDFILVRGEETSTEPLKDDRLDYYAPPRCKQTDIDRMGVIWRIGEQFNAIEAETWANIVAISGGNLFLSDRMSVLNERGIKILENAFCLAGDEVRPVYLKDDHRVPSLWLGDRGILLVNWEEIPKTITVTGIHQTLIAEKAFIQEGDKLTATLLPHESFAACYQQ